MYFTILLIHWVKCVTRRKKEILVEFIWKTAMKSLMLFCSLLTLYHISFTGKAKFREILAYFCLKI